MKIRAWKTMNKFIELHENESGSSPGFDQEGRYICVPTDAVTELINQLQKVQGYLGENEDYREVEF